ncbi:hypothetical protein MMC14_010471 [Varicellaria rhodocarpa]|nr:hypothetical protein [Varicellaria rhodocarpa]
MAAAGCSVYIDLTKDSTKENGSGSFPEPSSAQVQQDVRGVSLQQKSSAGRLNARTPRSQAHAPRSTAQCQTPTEPVLLRMPLASSELQRLGLQAKPQTAAIDGQDGLLDHVAMMDVLRVLDDSRPGEGRATVVSFRSLQPHYLQGLSETQAFHQGRVLVYVEWLTYTLYRHGMTVQHERLYAAVLEMCKASQRGAAAAWPL